MRSTTFSRWLEIGDEIFSYSIKALPAIADKGINVPEDFNRSLLEHGPDDLRPSKDLEQDPKKRVIGTTRRSIFNPLRLVLGGTPKPQKQLEASPEPLLLTAAGEPPTPEVESEHEEPASLFSAFDPQSDLRYRREGSTRRVGRQRLRRFERR
jgi:hypothetical protein